MQVDATTPVPAGLLRVHFFENYCQAEGAWITSGTPGRPRADGEIDSFNPNLCVVTFSSGKRWMRAARGRARRPVAVAARALDGDEFTVTRSSGNSGIPSSALDHDRPALALQASHAEQDGEGPAPAVQSSATSRRGRRDLPDARERSSFCTSIT